MQVIGSKLQLMRLLHRLRPPLKYSEMEKSAIKTLRWNKSTEANCFRVFLTDGPLSKGVKQK